MLFSKIKSYAIGALALALPILYVMGQVKGRAREKTKVLENMKTILLLIVSLSLTGCVTTVYRTQLEVYCPSMAQYDDRFNNQLADEIDALPPDSRAIEEAMKNYIYLRDRIRRCEAERNKING